MNFDRSRSLRRRWLGLTAAAVTLAAGGSALASPAPTCTTIRRGAGGTVTDALLADDKPGANHGASAAINVGSVPPGHRESLLRFDLGAVPPGSIVTSAKITLNRSLGGGADVRVHRATAPWSELGVTWSSFNGAYSPTVETTFPGSPAIVGADVTRLVQTWVSGVHENDGVLLETAPTSTTVYSSSEASNVALRPRLDLCWVPPTGAVEWSRIFPATYPAKIAAGPGGSAAITGFFADTLDLGGGPMIADGYDVFIANLDPAGNLLWSRQIGGPGYVDVVSVAVDPTGNVVVAGHFNGDIDFGGGIVPGYASLYVATYSPLGAFVSMVRHDGAYMVLRDMAISPTGIPTITGYFSTAMDGLPSPDVAAGGYINASNIFLLPGGFFGTAGNGPPGAHGHGNGEALAFGPTGDAFLLGEASGGVDFGGGVVGTGTFVARFGPSTTTVIGLDAIHDFGIFTGDAGGNNRLAIDAAGNLVYGYLNSYGYIGELHSFAGAGWSLTHDLFAYDPDDGAGTLALDPGGNPVVGGYFAPSGSSLAKLSAGTGNIVWSKTGFPSPTGVATTGSGDVLITGTTRGNPVDFGAGPIASGPHDVYVARLRP